MTTHFFAGANSGGGFQNLFAQIADPETVRDFILLKGGAGVGKNTFLRLLGQAMEEEGLDVEYLHCSGDPDSLDAITVPAIACAAADATAPHVLEPVYPAAADRYLDLGRFYDLTAAKEDAEAVRAHTRAYRAAYGRAYHALRAAREVELEGQTEWDESRAARRMEGILRRELRRKGGEEGRVTRRFLGSLTHRGYVWRFDSVETLADRVYVLLDRDARSGPLLRQACAAAAARGWNTIACMNPEDPARIDHLLLPSLRLAFVSSRPEMEYPGTAFRRVHLETARAGQGGLERKIVRLLRAEAVECLRQAKAEHDLLEAVYNPYVDFDGVRAVAAQEIGRWSAYAARRE